MKIHSPRFYFQPGLNVRAYEARAEQEARTFEDHLPFYRDLARRVGGAVLELGAGTGRIASAMAETGARVTGLEYSRPMLEEARRLRPSLEFIQGDMSDFSLNRTFDLVCIPFRGLHELLSREKQESCLKRCRDHLKPGGLLAFDLFDPKPSAVSRAFDPEAVDLPPLDLGGSTLLTSVGERTNDGDQQVLTEYWTFREVDSNGRLLSTQREIHSMRWVWKDEMAEMLVEAGLRAESLWADFSGTPYLPGREQVWIAARS